MNLNNRSAEAWALRGVAQEKAGKKQDAIESYNRAKGVDPNNSTAAQGLGRVQGGVAGLFR